MAREAGGSGEQRLAHTRLIGTCSTPDFACFSGVAASHLYKQAQTSQRQKKGSAPAPAPCTVHTSAPHQRYTPGHTTSPAPHQLHSQFTFARALHSPHSQLHSHVPPCIPPASHPFHTHFTTPHTSFRVHCSDCYLSDHGSLVVCLCLMGQYLTCSGISCDSCLANIDHFSALQAAAARAGAPARGWRGSRRRWCFSGRRGSSSGQ